MVEKSNLPGGVPDREALSFEQQYQIQVIEMVGAERLQKVAHDHREQVHQTMVAILNDPPGISSPEVREAALAFASSRGEASADACEHLIRAMIDYRPAAQATGEGGELKAFENALAKLLDERGKLIKEERQYQEQAQLHRAEALRIKALIEKGPGGIH